MMAAGQERDALRLAASFPRLGEEKLVITRAWAATTNPGFYQQMGKNPEDLYRAGIDAILIDDDGASGAVLLEAVRDRGQVTLAMLSGVALVRLEIG